MLHITAIVIVLISLLNLLGHVHVHAADQTIGAAEPYQSMHEVGAYLISNVDWISSINGVLTHVSFRTGAMTAVSTLKIYTLRPNGNNWYGIVGKSSVTGTFPIMTSQVNIPLDSPLPILPGDYVAYSVDTENEYMAIVTSETATSTILRTTVHNGTPNSGTCVIMETQTNFFGNTAIAFFIDEQVIAAPYTGQTCGMAPGGGGGPTPPVGGASGDPQFAGLQGQSFQVHGFADTYFNLISTPTLQMNGRFAYIANGQCTQNYTECWTHPGTYIDRIGVQLLPIDGHLLRIELIAGPRTMKVFVNGDMIEMDGANRVYRYHADGHVNTTETSSLFAITSIEYEWLNFYTFHLHTNLWDIFIYNSQDFFNMQVALLDRQVMKAGSMYYDEAKSVKHHHHHHHIGTLTQFYPHLPIHGFIGNTWKNMKYENGKLYQGSVSDYETSGAFGVNSLYNHFIINKP